MTEIQLDQEEALSQYLTQLATRAGFSEEKKKMWVHYSLDTSRGKNLSADLIQHFGIDTSKQRESSALDVGCGFGGLMLALRDYFHQVSGLDHAEDRAHWAKKRMPDSEIICADATNLQWPDEQFDLVTAIDVFEHVTYQQQDQIASEISRVLKPKGYAFISVPNRFQLFDEHNFVYFGTWMPNFLREKYVKAFSKNSGFIECWERTGSGWKSLFEGYHFKVELKKVQPKRRFPPTRFDIYLSKM